jgi:hypothetical protein
MDSGIAEIVTFHFTGKEFYGGYQLDNQERRRD